MVDDAPVIENLTRLAYEKWVPMIGRAPLPMTTNYTEAINVHIVDVLERNGELYGAIELVREDDHLLIENIAVHPDQQRQGIGSLLLGHAERSACAFGLLEVRLYTNALFTTNLMFYAKNGYAELERSTVIPGSITVYMNKMLSADI